MALQHGFRAKRGFSPLVTMTTRKSSQPKWKQQHYIFVFSLQRIHLLYFIAIIISQFRFSCNFNGKYKVIFLEAVPAEVKSNSWQSNTMHFRKSNILFILQG